MAAAMAAGLVLVVPARLVAQDTTSSAKTHTVKKGDTLWDLAAKYLSDAFRWPEIYRLNTDVIQDPHWIYPGEVLKLPGYVAAETPVSAPNPTTNPTPTNPPTVPVESLPPKPAEPTAFRPAAPVAAPVTAQPLAVPTATTDTTRAIPGVPVVAPKPVVPFGAVVRAPWIERREGPPVWGRIIGSAEVPGIDPARQRGRYQPHDRLLIAPPTGSVAPEHELYLSYRFGPLLEGVGQVIVPTGVVEVIRAPRDGDAAVAQVVRMFSPVEERDRLIPYDSSIMTGTGSPVPIKNGIEGGIRWVVDDPVLPPLDNYLLLTLTAGDGLKPGDELELFKPRIKSTDEGIPNTPEVHIGKAQVVRVTPLGATAMITRLDQPKVDKNTRVRLIARMQ
jgi:LysM repeat protein